MGWFSWAVGDVGTICCKRLAVGPVFLTPHLDGKKLTFTVDGDNFVDGQTGSTWNLLGKATAGSLKGKKLAPIVHRQAQFWFSWVVWRPDTMVYRGKG